MGKSVEILAGDGFENAVKAFGAKAEKKWGNDEYEVWSIEADDLKRMDVYPSVYWQKEWGWFRYAEGTNIERWPTFTFTVKGEEMLGWYDPYLDDEDFGETHPSLTEYLHSALDVSAETNVCAVSVGLAKLNGITLAELFERYE